MLHFGEGEKTRMAKHALAQAMQNIAARLDEAVMKAKDADEAGDAKALEEALGNLADVSATLTETLPRLETALGVPHNPPGYGD